MAITTVNTDYIKEIFANMMDHIQAAYDTENDPVEKPYAIYGRVNEVIQVLKEKDKHSTYKFKKYPCIILYHSQEEKHGTDIPTNYMINPLVSIVTNSNRNLKTSTRYTNIIEPVLYPIMELFLQEIADNPCFYQSYKEEIERDIRVWDGNPNSKTAGILYHDYLDGIDIQLKNLRVFVNKPYIETA